jgi:hypothetical protein
MKWTNQKDGSTYIPDTVGRTLRLMQESRVIAVRYEGKNTVYKFLPLYRRHDYIPLDEREAGKEHILFKSQKA